MAQEDYRKALRLGQKEFRSSVLKGTYPYLQALDEILEHTAVEYTEPLGVVNIPLASIVGTKTAGRKTAFAGNFMPLLDEDTEFAQKWNALCDAHLSVGIRDPIKAYEYMNKFYVEEGNKRVSVMKYYEAMSIPGSVTRIVPRRSEDKENKIYYEFLDFYDLTGVNYLWFSQLGRFRAMDQAVNSRPGQPWSKEDRRDFQTAYYNFEDAFHRCGGARLPITVGDALLKFVGVYPYETIRDKTGREMAAELEKMWSEIEALTQDEAVELSLEPTTQAPPLISRILPLEQSRLNVAFLYEKSADTSAWTYAHEFGRGHVDEVLAGRVFTKGYDNIRVGENDDEVIERAIADGNDVLFTTTPKLMECSLRAAIRHPEVKILNCSLNMDHPSVRTYYGRIYEAKFLVGAIAGALADNNRVGYIANYPIYGMVAGINAFALGARMANPRAKVHLMWTGEKGVDALSELEKRGVELISSQDAGRYALWPVPFGRGGAGASGNAILALGRILRAYPAGHHGWPLEAGGQRSGPCGQLLVGHGLGNDRRAAKPQPAPRDEAPCRDPSQRPVLGHDRPVRRRTVRPGRRDDTGRRQTDGAGGDSAHGLAGGKCGRPYPGL